jgi:hypothetical protein
MAIEALVLSVFRAVVAPEFGPGSRSERSDDQVLAIIRHDLTTCTLDEDEFGIKYPEAVAELAAHRLTLQAGANGPESPRLRSHRPRRQRQRAGLRRLAHPCAVASAQPSG